MTWKAFPFIMLDGNAKEAIAFYKAALEAEVLFCQTFGDAPEKPGKPLPVGLKGLVAHSVLRVGESHLMVSDKLSDSPQQSGSQVQICITTNQAEKSEAFYESLKRDGQVKMPLQQTHFSPAYGMVTDKYGVTFQIVTVSTEEAVRRGHENEA